jgi:2-polyprenyl-6-methoxyphenol hydroxylase-like FAD-dependent oxidoreductase
MRGQSKVDVLVIGGGPVGLAMGCELLRYGLSCRVVEVKREREPWSKAAAIQPRTLEVLRRMGVAEPIVKNGNPIYGMNIRAKGRLLSHVDISLDGTPYPYMLGLSQKRTEEILEGQLKDRDGALERGVELTAFEQSASGVLATLTRHDGEVEEVEASYLIGCDGARSFVRKSLGLAFEGSTFEQTLVHADLQVDFPFEVDPHEGHAFIAEGGALGFLPLFGEGKYRLIAMAPAKEIASPTLEDFEDLVKERAPEFDIKLSNPEWLMAFRFHSRIVSQYRVGRVLLAGDAAHIHSPAGAQGMNIGIQDAFNLAWKLALVHRGLAKDELLDSYDAERRPVGKTVVETTDAGTQRALRVMKLRNPIAVGLRNQLIKFVTASHLVTDRAFEAIAGLKTGYAGSPIVSQYHSSIWQAKIGSSRTDETPDLRSWMRFEHGPAVGSRVADMDLVEEGTTLFDLLTGTNHQLFLFDGAADTADGYENLATIARHVQEQYGGAIFVYTVVPNEKAADALEGVSPLINDHDFELHSHFGAGTESLYLVRPDGYVGYRSQPAEAEHLYEYLSSLFLAIYK